MPSSYTPILRLTLPATGELTGVWGTTVNNGITSLIESSIAGTASITMTDADYTLTVANGTTDESRSMFVTLTGTLTAARNVICPAVSKLYFVHNNTTGGYAITFKTSAGTGISVPNGTRMVLHCNGTDVVDSVTSFSSLSLATPLGVSSGGSGVATLTGIVKGNGTSAFSAAVSGVDIKTVGGVSLLGSGDVPVNASSFPSGTVMIFAQTAAPTGWTKSTTHNDKALRVVSGTASSGGTTAFSSVFASRTPTGSVSTTVNNTTATGSISTTVNATTAAGTIGATTLTTNQIPSHSHVVNAGTNAGASGTAVNVNSGTTNSQATGGGLSHDHTFTGTSHSHTASSSFTGTAHNHTASSSFTGNAMDFAVQYVDVILASKD